MTDLEQNLIDSIERFAKAKYKGQLGECRLAFEVGVLRSVVREMARRTDVNTVMLENICFFNNQSSIMEKL